jgi:hypothetical protein
MEANAKLKHTLPMRRPRSKRRRRRRLSVFMRVVLAIMATTLIGNTFLIFALSRDIQRVENKVDGARTTPPGELRRLP